MIAYSISCTALIEHPLSGVRVLIYTNVAENAAREAGEVLKANLGKVQEITFKSKNSLVTEVDKLSEEIIIQSIKRSFPSHDIFAEESGRHSTSSDYVWIIDPLDGTTNYAHGYPFFSISIALEIEGIVKPVSFTTR